MDRARPVIAGTVGLPIFRSEPHRCSYLPGRTAEDVFTAPATLHPAVYQLFMDAGFRRSGSIVYRPDCEGCRECVPIRVPVAHFAPSRSQRRVLKRNRDVRMEIGTPAFNDDKWRLYVDYLRYQHDGSMSQTREDLESFLYRSPTKTLEMTYWLEKRLVGVGIVDVTPVALSSVYFYFDPVEGRRSLGVHSALTEIEECRRRGLAWWYIGYFVRDCRRMNYKADYRPHELLGADGVWRSGTDRTP